MATRTRNRRQIPQPSPTTRPWPASLLSLVLLGLTLGGIAFGYHTLSRPGYLPLRVVKVDGEFRHLEPDRIERTVVAAIDGGFFSCDMQRLRSAVLAMPWVEDVSIRRVWPDSLHMRVTEQVPLARWGDDALVNVQSSVFRPQSLSGYDELVGLRGPAGSAARVVAFYRAVLPAARTRQLTIRAVELDERRHWWLRFDNGLTLSLGREDVEHRLAQFFRVYPSLVADAQRRPVRIDMRYAHGFAVRWQEPEKTPETEKLQDKA